MKDLPARVLEQLLKRHTIPDELAELIYWLIAREVEKGYTSLQYHQYVKDNDLLIPYTLTLHFILSRLKHYKPLGKGLFDVPIHQVAQLKDHDLYSIANVSIFGFHEYDHSEMPPEVRRYEGDFFKHYIRGMWRDLLSFRVSIDLPLTARFEHTHICASTGSGKTQLIQAMVAKDILTSASIIVMAPKGTMIPTITKLSAIDPDRLILITPEHPPALNIFNLGTTSTAGETNIAVGLINYIFSAILQNETTGRQTGLLNSCIRLMLVVPNATIKTFRNLLKQPTADEYKDYFPLLSESGQEFFTEQFSKTKIYGDTKEQILQRLDFMLENPIIANIFSQPETRFNMKQEMEAGKIILIDTSIKHLGEFGSSFLGRFFIALVSRASEQRDTTKALRPVWFYIDEASTYLSESIETLLERARESKVGLVLAHQQLAQLSRISPQLEASVLTNTSIKIIGGCSYGDANTFAKEMMVEAVKLQSQKPLHFHIRVKGEGAVPVVIKAGYMEGLPRRSEGELGQVIEQNRAKYSAKPRAKTEQKPKTVVDDDDDIESLNKS